MRSRRRIARLVHASLLLGAVGALASTAFAGCSSSEAQVGPGGECSLATDCKPGLVCIEQQNQSRVCSNDLTSVEGKLPAEAGAAEAGPVPEGGTPEGGEEPVDSGSPPVDSGSQPPKDSGSD